MLFKILDLKFNYVINLNDVKSSRIYSRSQFKQTLWQPSKTFIFLNIFLKYKELSFVYKVYAYE